MRALIDEHAAAAEAKGLTGKATLWTLRREEIEADLLWFLAEDGAYRVAYGTVPDAVEVPFGLDPGTPGVEVEIGGGRRVAFRGRADRIDVAPDGTQVVLDYKTGSPPKYDASVRDDPVRGGRRLQLPVYAAAARQLRGATDVEAAYWYVSEAGGWQRERVRPRRRQRRAVPRRRRPHRRRHRRGSVPTGPRRLELVPRNRRPLLLLRLPGPLPGRPDRPVRREARVAGVRAAPGRRAGVTDRCGRIMTATDPRRRGRTSSDHRRRAGRAPLRRGGRGHRQDQAARRPCRRARCSTAAIPMREIAAVTFTEAAAAELRTRIREAFERLVDDDATPDDRRDQAEAALAELDSAAIGTVHSFAQRLLSEHPIEAGLPPHVEVLDEVESLLAFGDRWEEHVDEMFADARPRRRPDLRRACSACGSTIRASRRCATSPAPSATTGTGSTTSPRSRSRCRPSTARRRPRRWPSSPRCSTAAGSSPTTSSPSGCSASSRRWSSSGGRWSRAPTGPCGGRWPRATLRRRRRGRTRPRAAPPPGVAREEKAAAGGRRGRRPKPRWRRCTATPADAVLRVLAGSVARFTLDAAAARRREGRLEFHDLLVLARQLLRTSAAGAHGAARPLHATAHRRVPGHRPDPDRARGAARGERGRRRRCPSDGRTSSSTTHVCSSSVTRSSRSTASGGPTSACSSTPGTASSTSRSG